MDLNGWKERIKTDRFREDIRVLYSDEVGENTARYGDLLSLFEKTFGDEGELTLFSAPGRTEIGGNHTDHQHGCALGIETIALSSICLYNGKSAGCLETISNAITIISFI